MESHDVKLHTRLVICMASTMPMAGVQVDLNEGYCQTSTCPPTPAIRVHLRRSQVKSNVAEATGETEPCSVTVVFDDYLRIFLVASSCLVLLPSQPEFPSPGPE